LIFFVLFIRSYRNMKQQNCHFSVPNSVVRFMVLCCSVVLTL
jgi:hypothetical protein